MLRENVALIGIVLAVGCSKKAEDAPPAPAVPAPAAPAPTPPAPAAPAPAPAAGSDAPLTFITTADLAAKMAAGPAASWDFTLVDARSRVEFEDKHIDGAVNIPAEVTRDQLPKLVAAKDRRLVFYCNGPNCTKSQKGARAATALGYANVLEYNEGLPAWLSGKHPTAGKELPAFDTPTISAADFDQARKSRAINLVDIRIADEFAKFHVPGALDVPLDDVQSRLKDIPAGPIVLVDHAGHQTAIAGRLLASLGRKELQRLDGGMLAWQRAGLPTEPAAKP